MDHDLSNEFAAKLSLLQADTTNTYNQHENQNLAVSLESLTQMLSEIQLQGDTRNSSEDQNASDNTSLNSSRSSGRDASGQRERNNKDRKARRVFVGNLSFKTSWQDLKDHMRQAGNVRKVDLFKDSRGRSKGCGLVEYETTLESARAIQQMHLTRLDGREILVREDDASQAKFDKQMFSSRNRRSRSPRWIERYERDSRSPYRRRRDGSPRRKSRSRSAEKRRGSSPSRPKSSPRRDRKYGQRSSSRRDGDLFITRNYSKDCRRGFERGYRILVQNIPWGVTWQQLKNAFKEFGHVLRAEVPLNSSGRSAGYGLVTFERKKDAYAAIDDMDGVKFNGRTILVKMC